MYFCLEQFQRCKNDLIRDNGGRSRRADDVPTTEREAKSRVIEKKPPKAAINLGTDVDAPWGEKIETSRKDNHQIA